MFPATNLPETPPDTPSSLQDTLEEIDEQNLDIVDQEKDMSFAEANEQFLRPKGTIVERYSDTMMVIHDEEIDSNTLEEDENTSIGEEHHGQLLRPKGPIMERCSDTMVVVHDFD